MTTPMSRTTTPWKFPSTNTTVSGTAVADDDADSPSRPLPLLCPLRRGPSADEDMRRAGGRPRSTSSAVAPTAVVAPNTIMLFVKRNTGENQKRRRMRSIGLHQCEVIAVARRVNEGTTDMEHANGEVSQ